MQPATTPDHEGRPRSSPPNSGSGRRSRDAHRVVVIGGGGFGGAGPFFTGGVVAAGWIRKPTSEELPI